MSPSSAAADSGSHRPLNRQDVKTLSLSALGGTLEFYDFVIFIFFAAVLGHLFFPPDMPAWLVQLQTLGIFAAGYLARPLGGIVIAHFGDKLGRKRMFTLSIFLMAVPTLLIGLLPTYAAWGVAAPLILLLLRILQGAAIGGEMPGAWVFVKEHVPGHRAGLGIGLLTAGITGGIFLGAMVSIVLHQIYTEAEVLDFAWRIPFILGGVFGLLAVYLRRYLSETPVFRELAAQRALSRELPLRTVIREHKLACAVTALLTWPLSTAIIIMILMTPNLLQTHYGFSASQALEANAIATLALTLGCVVFGMLADRFGARLTIMLGWTGLAVTSYSFYLNLPDLSFGGLVTHYAVVGFFCGTISTTPIVAVRVFPADVRYSGLSFAYNMAYAIFGGLTPVATQLWLQQDLLAPAHYVALIAMVGVLTALLLPLSAAGERRRPLAAI